jgi:hypothetical protein
VRVAVLTFNNAYPWYMRSVIFLRLSHFLCVNENLFARLFGMTQQELEALGHRFIESDLPPIVCEWRVGDDVLCLTAMN